MSSRQCSLARLLLFAAAMAFALTGCSRKLSAQGTPPVDLHLDVKTPFRFVAYGDSRFHDPKDTEAADPAVRVTLVQKIA